MIEMPLVALPTVVLLCDDHAAPSGDVDTDPRVGDAVVADRHGRATDAVAVGTHLDAGVGETADLEAVDRNVVAAAHQEPAPVLRGRRVRRPRDAHRAGRVAGRCAARIGAHLDRQFGDAAAAEFDAALFVEPRADADEVALQRGGAGTLADAGKRGRGRSAVSWSAGRHEPGAHEEVALRARRRRARGKARQRQQSNCPFTHAASRPTPWSPLRPRTRPIPPLAALARRRGEAGNVRTTCR